MHSEVQGAEATIDDHLRNLIQLMKRGGRISITDIPNDPTFLSSHFGGTTAQAMAEKLETALSAAEPVEPLAWYWEDKTGCFHITMDRPDVQDMAEIVGCVPSPLYAAPPAPSVDVKAFKTNKEMLTAFGAEDIREGSRMCFEANGEDTWEDYYEVPLHALDRISSALSAQVQDVATIRARVADVLDSRTIDDGTIHLFNKCVDEIVAAITAAPAKQEG